MIGPSHEGIYYCYNRKDSDTMAMTCYTSLSSAICRSSASRAFIFGLKSWLVNNYAIETISDWHSHVEQLGLQRLLLLLQRKSFLRVQLRAKNENQLGLILQLDSPLNTHNTYPPCPS